MLFLPNFLNALFVQVLIHLVDISLERKQRREIDGGLISLNFSGLLPCGHAYLVPGDAVI